jgi:hypothetical protein
MSEDIHKKAERLIAAARVEGISDAERAWLSSHLESCGRCSAYAETLKRAVEALRSIAVFPRPALLETTRWRIEMRARELREERSRMRALWIACGASWVLGALTAPLLWQGFAWAGRHLALPDLVWQAAFVLWWLVPAAVTGGALAWWSTRGAGERGLGMNLPF